MALYFVLDRFTNVPTSFEGVLEPREIAMYRLLQTCANMAKGGRSIRVKGQTYEQLEGFFSIVRTKTHWKGVRTPVTRRRALRGLAEKGIITYESSNYGTKFKILVHPRLRRGGVDTPYHQVNSLFRDQQYSSYKQRPVWGNAPRNVKSSLSVWDVDTTTRYNKEIHSTEKGEIPEVAMALLAQFKGAAFVQPRA